LNFFKEVSSLIGFIKPLLCTCKTSSCSAAPLCQLQAHTARVVQGTEDATHTCYF